MLDNLVCPISNSRIDRNVVRTNGFISSLLLAAYVLTRSPWIIIPVGLDYMLRAQMSGTTSPMTLLSRQIAKLLKFPFRATDKAPKVFASRIGACFAMGAALTHFLAPEVAPWLAGTLAVFAALESVADFCFGCVVYTYVALPLYRARDAVRSIPLFRELEEPMLVGLAEGFQSVDFPQGTRILTEGEPGDAMYVLRSGEVEVYHDGPEGRPNVVATYKPRDHFGEMALLTGQPRVAHVRAVTPVAALQLRKTDFDALLARHPGMRAILEKTASERLAAEVATPGVGSTSEAAARAG